MLRSEFETLAKRTVTDEQYTYIEGLYMESNLDKYNFIKSIKNLLSSIPEETEKTILTMGIRDRSGHYWTPNRCWRHTVKVELVDVDIRMGKSIVRIIPGSYELGYGIDFLDCDDKYIIID